MSLGAVQKATELRLNFITNARLRGYVLNATLILVFGSAWVSDRWPELTVPALSFAAAFVLAEVGLAYLAAKRMSTASKAASHEALETTVELYVSKLGLDYKPLVIDFERGNLVESYLKLRTTGMDLAIEAFLLANTDYKRLSRAIQKEALLQKLVDKSMSQRWVPPVHGDLSTWLFTEHSDKDFNLAAGAFEIQHFHGHTNIIVRDTSAVTVEKRQQTTVGSKTPHDEGNWLDIRQPAYH